ncbi:MAG: NAD-dependent epimerase/dehydratase family protein [Pseudolabrys sp.]
MAAVAPVLVTGAAGFIGFHVARRLLQDGKAVVGLDNVNDYYDPKLKEARLAELSKLDGFEFARLNLADRDGIAALFRRHRFPYVINLAAQAGVRHSLIDPYAYVDANLVYGPWGRPDMAMWLFAKAILAGEPIKLFNNGDMRRDFTYIDDIAEAIVRLVPRASAPNPAWSSEAPDPGSSNAPWRVYNIGNNNPVELMEVVRHLEESLGKKAKREMLPMQPGDVPATYADVDALMHEVDFKPATPIGDGIARFIAWYKEYHGL